MIYTTLYNPAIDLIYKVDDLSLRDTFLNTESSRYPAGKGLNVAKVIATLGEEVTLLTVMPRDDSDRFNRVANELNINIESYLIDGSVRINTTILNGNGHTIHLNSSTTPLSIQVQDLFMKLVLSKIKKDDYWILSGSLPKGIEPNAYADIIKKIKSVNGYSFLDTSGEALIKGVKNSPTLITPNEQELEQLTKESIKGIKDIHIRAKNIIEKNRIDMICVTLGEDGLLAIKGDEHYLITPPEVDSLDTVGCGDAFLGGFAVGKYRGFSFKESCRLAVASGTSNAMNIGPGNINIDDVWHIMENVKVVEL